MDWPASGEAGPKREKGETDTKWLPRAAGGALCANKLWPLGPADDNKIVIVIILIIVIIVVKAVNVEQLTVRSRQGGEPTQAGGPQQLNPLTRDTVGEWQGRQVPAKHCA